MHATATSNKSHAMLYEHLIDKTRKLGLTDVLKAVTAGGYGQRFVVIFMKTFTAATKQRSPSVSHCSVRSVGE